MLLPSRENVVAVADELVESLGPNSKTIMIEVGIGMIMGTTTMVEQLSIDGVSQPPKDLGSKGPQWVPCHPKGKVSILCWQSVTTRF